MHTTSIHHPEKGAALLTALVFLIIITLLTISAMRSSTLELSMASNEQMMTEAVQSAQSAIDILITPVNFPVTTNYIGCYNGYTPTTGTCATTGTLPAAAGTSSATNEVGIKLVGVGSFSCRACESSTSLFEGAVFEIESTYDNTDNRGGRAEIVEGFITLIPKN